MKLIFAFKSYMNAYFPNLEIRYIHALLAALVIWQIINSNFIHAANSETLELSSGFFLWLHIVFGCLTTITSIATIRYMLFKQSIIQFFPYLYGDNRVLKEDLKQLLHAQLPEAQEKGIANVVQGLGVAALILIEGAALTWLVLWLNDSPYAIDARETHKTLTSLIEIYLIAHAGMAILHFYTRRT